MRQFLLYAVIRLGLWILLWWALTLLDVGVMLAGVLAALIAMLISILFLDRLRDAAAMRWKAADERRAERRGPDIDEDAEYEDAMLDDAARNGEAGTGSDLRGAGAAGPAAGPAQLPDLDEPDHDQPGPDQPGQVRGSDR
ncbi:DUF4229 domain-containing protein [Brachybacterium sp. AOP29-B2-41]|uniref:DUF4229 domain-containing protein n=1 Tax=Brachybacterium sp. AOP29-B2-41 TaxID=3457704 RepID=UPI0040348872